MDRITLLKLASASRPATKIAARAALKAAGVKQTLADDLLAVTADLKAAADQARRYTRLHRRLGYCPVDITARRLPYHYGQPAGNGVKLRAPDHGTPGLRPVRLPAGTPAQRLDALRRADVAAAYRRIYRAAAHGELSVDLTRDPAAVGIKQAERHEWARKGARYSTRYQDTAITVPAEWRVRVARRGLAAVDSMMTLDAAPIEGAPAGIELHAAIWLVQGRGTSVTAQRGVIARTAGLSYHGTDASQALAGLSYHGTDASQALAGLKRKQRAAEWDATLRAAEWDATLRAAEWDATLRAADLSALIEKSGSGIVVSIADARAVGACEYGIKSWCHRTGLPYDAGSATLGQVYDAYRRDPAPEARAAMLHALRRSRRHLIIAA